ncbi:MAG: iron-containing alcohol dehydrogenase [Synergistaceae bacterium]|jgi:3-deoxy-alpha-D-manno-octulosonate 8-oxidase|nr:iron-containing alcohol dehydrogenase [Synergistaceae bacterium]
MSGEPKTMRDFVKAPRWWRTEILTEVVQSEDGVGDLLRLLKERGRAAYFIIDEALSGDVRFGPILEQDELFVFLASESEPRTGDVDRLVALIREKRTQPDTIVGVGGGSSIDLAKAAGICLANPASAAEYQGYGLDMKRGAEIWVLPTLNGTGAEVTPIAVLRGPEKKLGINNNFTAPSVAVIDPQLSSGAPKFNRFYTMMDCFFHHYEIAHSRTSEEAAILDASDGLRMARSVLAQDLTKYALDRAIISAMASILGGSSTIGGRVGVSHAISYGLSNSSPKLPHSVAVTMAMLACGDIYNDGGYEETVKFLRINKVSPPRARDYGIDESQTERMTKTALGMDKLWLSHFGPDWKNTVDAKFVEGIYRRIVAA